MFPNVCSQREQKPKKEGNRSINTKRLRNPLIRGFLTYEPEEQAVLFELNLGASLFELLLEAFSVSLSETFLNGAGSSVYEFLSFLEAKAGEFLHELHNRRS